MVEILDDYSEKLGVCVTPLVKLEGEGLNVPDGCWDLDPGATPEQLLQADADADEEEKKVGVTGVEGRLSHLL
nr:hypothetical protein [Tanacetum cinerariifolium]